MSELPQCTHHFYYPEMLNIYLHLYIKLVNFLNCMSHTHDWKSSCCLANFSFYIYLKRQRLITADLLIQPLLESGVHRYLEIIFSYLLFGKQRLCCISTTSWNGVWNRAWEQSDILGCTRRTCAEDDIYISGQK